MEWPLRKNYMRIILLPVNMYWNCYRRIKNTFLTFIDQI